MNERDGLVARGLVKRFSKDRPSAVDNISLSVSRGEVLSIVGPNGAGKSTLIQLLLGLLVPDSGSIHLFGEDMTLHRRRIAHRINYASTDLSLPYSLTVRENLDVFALVYDLPNPRKAVDRILETFSLGCLARIRVGKLSTGQIARLGIAKALLSSPEVLFLDEPTATLDPEAAQEIRVLLQNHVRNSGLGLVYTSHNMREVERLSDRILLIESGRMVAEGTADELCRKFESSDLESVFLKSMLEAREHQIVTASDQKGGVCG
ncbi:MAG: ABC transporter ATP-binding protein [Leptospirales bacterium]